ncbi:hypothetical protein [Methylovorus sp. MP688]|uniref:hypothetical protein n=1 Tax=Methylovorus sp. (strain MP688) TaxID=887061 RepID=UPI0001EC4E7C|nr:hypothetical protein [Methylovorus sp. MP688]ADQ85301.1 conserved hypothetical protein [Methylovorus sp. MP688]
MRKNYLPLSDVQKKRLAILEPRLRNCVPIADINNAKIITAEIQSLLRNTGHETRLQQAKNWLYETSIEANNLTFAKMGLEGTRQKVSPKTRVYLEATALLAICHLRENELNKAKFLIHEAVESINNITSEKRKSQFHRRLIIRLEEESILAGLIEKNPEEISIDRVDKEAAHLVMTKNEDEILLQLGNHIPKKSIDLLTYTRETYKNRLPAPDYKLLPPPPALDKSELGKRAQSALKRVAWKALCNSESELHKAWSEGLSVVHDKKYISAAIITAFGSWSISGAMIAITMAALAIKFGAEVFCEIYKPEFLMIDQKDKS